MARWSRYEFTLPNASKLQAILEQLSSGPAFYVEATGAVFVVPVPASCALLADGIAKPLWGRSDPPPDPGAVPNVLTAEQLRKALEAIGKLALVQPAITAMTEPRRTQAQIEWDRRPVYERQHPLIVNLQAGLILTSAQVDAFFRAGAAL